MLDVRYADLAAGVVGLGVQRSMLSEILAPLVRDAGATVRLAAEITAAEPAGDAATLIDTAGRRHGPFQLVVAADGARSALRRGLPIVRRDRPYPWGALWFLADDPHARFGTELRQVYRGTRTMLGFLPSGRAAPEAPPRVSVFWSTPLRDAHAPIELDRWRHELAALAPAAAPLLDQVRGANDLVFAAYRDVVLSRPHHGPIAFIGDAAHAMSPQLGQGVNLALLDAEALAIALRTAPTTPRALAAYHKRRHGSTRSYQRASRALTPWFQSGIAPLGPIRDLAMPVACRFPPARRQMLLALAGVKTGTFTADPLPGPYRPAANAASRSASVSAGHAS